MEMVQASPWQHETPTALSFPKPIVAFEVHVRARTLILPFLTRSCQPTSPTTHTPEVETQQGDVEEKQLLPLSVTRRPSSCCVIADHNRALVTAAYCQLTAASQTAVRSCCLLTRRASAGRGPPGLWVSDCYQICVWTRGSCDWHLKNVG